MGKRKKEQIVPTADALLNTLSLAEVLIQPATTALCLYYNEVTNAGILVYYSRPVNWEMIRRGYAIVDFCSLRIGNVDDYLTSATFLRKTLRTIRLQTKWIHAIEESRSHRGAAMPQVVQVPSSEENLPQHWRKMHDKRGEQEVLAFLRKSLELNHLELDGD